MSCSAWVDVEALSVDSEQMPNDDPKRPYEPVIEAAVEWVERISSHPNMWADQQDLALIAAVKALTGATYPWERSTPNDQEVGHG